MATADTTPNKMHDNKIPDSLLQYFKTNGVNPEIIDLIDSIPRFIRIRHSDSMTLEQIKQELIKHPKCIDDATDHDSSIITTTPLSDFFQLPSSIKIAYLPSFKTGKLFGMDIASGICCRILNPQQKEHILDLCCAPGTKLLYIAHLMNNNGSVTGVDISENRLNVCRKLVRDHRVTNVRVICGDGCTFNEKPDISMGFRTTEIHPSCWNRKMIKKKRRRLRKQQKKQNRNSHDLESMNSIESTESMESMQRELKHKNVNGQRLYDRVLVDAQCTHDGSVRHLQKYRDEWGWDKLQKNVLNEDNVRDIVDLQKRLIFNGYRLLKSEGIMVYSTCSLSMRQNEEVVRYLLEMCDGAELMDIENDESLKGFKFVKGSLVNEKDASTRLDTSKCIRFDPFVSKTSGLFIAKICKSQRKQNTDKVIDLQSNA